MSTGPAVSVVSMTAFSDALCVWAYIAQIRLDEANSTFGDALKITQRCCSVFGDTEKKIGVGWAERGGYQGFNRHLREIGERFEHVTLHPDLWLSVRPLSSMSAHLTIKALQRIDERQADAFIRALRSAFFSDCRDIARWEVQRDVMTSLGVDVVGVQHRLAIGDAHASLAADLAAAEALHVQGSPTFVLNDGRQTLYGNVGYRVIEANIREILREPSVENASWC